MCTLLCVFISIAFGSAIAEISSGNCPKITVIGDFKPLKYMGKWFEIKRLSNMSQFKEKCVTNTFSPKDNGNYELWEEKIDTATDELMTKSQEAFAEDPKLPAKMGIWTSIAPVPFDYWVVDTDYTNYAVVHICSMFAQSKYENVWIYSRKPTLDSRIEAAIIEKLKAKGVDVSHLMTTDQKNCN